MEKKIESAFPTKLRNETKAIVFLRAPRGARDILAVRCMPGQDTQISSEDAATLARCRAAVDLANDRKVFTQLA